jgi:hypothetical protein
MPAMLIIATSTINHCSTYSDSIAFIRSGVTINGRLFRMGHITVFNLNHFVHLNQMIAGSIVKIWNKWKDLMMVELNLYMIELLNI